MASKEQKVEILDRLVKAGHIDLKEALTLMENTNHTTLRGVDVYPKITLNPKLTRVFDLEDGSSIEFPVNDHIKAIRLGSDRFPPNPNHTQIFY